MCCFQRKYRTALNPELRIKYIAMINNFMLAYTLYAIGCCCFNNNNNNTYVSTW